MVIRYLCPDQCLPSILEVDLEDLKNRGFRGIILDIDNTLLKWDNEEVDEEVIAWVEQVKAAGFRLCLTSNGLKERVRKVAALFGVPAISKAVKPRKRPFRQALELLGTTPQETVMIGDQIFTDILGGNRMEFYTILINPLGSEEMATTKLVRGVERRVIRRLHKKGFISDQDVSYRMCNDRER